VRLDIRAGARLPEQFELPARYVVSEELTNAAKHAGASEVHIDLAVDEESSVSRLATTRTG